MIYFLRLFYFDGSILLTRLHKVYLFLNVMRAPTSVNLLSVTHRSPNDCLIERHIPIRFGRFGKLRTNRLILFRRINAEKLTIKLTVTKSIPKFYIALGTIM